MTADLYTKSPDYRDLDFSRVTGWEKPVTDTAEFNCGNCPHNNEGVCALYPPEAVIHDVALFWLKPPVSDNISCAYHPGVGNVQKARKLLWKFLDSTKNP